MAMISVTGVTRTYGSGPAAVHALRGVDLEVAAGEYLAIMGPSGSGKSTLLNLISALDRPTAGEIVIDGTDITGAKDDTLTVFRRKNIGFVFQFFNLLPTLNARDNVLLPVMLERRPTSADAARCDRLLAEVGLKNRANHRIHELSGGEMQRVAIARALVLQPKLILADEPTGNLDRKTGAAVLDILRGTCHEHATTVVMVTHDHTAAEVASRVLTFCDGRIDSDQASPRLAMLAP
jgi:putative ABC transport system ATP-binding protein